MELVAQLERLKATASATQARSVHALSESRPVSAPRDAVRSLGSEVALARRESPSLGDRFVRVSRAPAMELPCTLAALDKGVIGERHAVEVVQQSAMLSPGDRAELDRRLGPVLARLTPQGPGGPRAVSLRSSTRRRWSRAWSGRHGRAGCVCARPQTGWPTSASWHRGTRPSGRTPLCAPMRAGWSGASATRKPADGRGVGAVMADTATRLLSGRARFDRCNRWRCTS